jgi:hypothetical protein
MLMATTRFLKVYLWIMIGLSFASIIEAAVLFGSKMTFGDLPLYFWIICIPLALALLVYNIVAMVILQEKSPRKVWGLPAAYLLMQLVFFVLGVVSGSKGLPINDRPAYPTHILVLTIISSLVWLGWGLWLMQAPGKR